MTPPPILPQSGDLVASDTYAPSIKVCMEFWAALPRDEVDLNAASFHYDMKCVMAGINKVLGLRG